LAERLVGHSRVAAHHPLCLPSAKRHDDGRREAGIKSHSGAVVAAILKVKVLQTGGSARNG
jgi:hypothetical protein